MGLFDQLFGTKKTVQKSPQKDICQQLEKLGKEAVMRYLDREAAGLEQKDEEIDAVFHKYEIMSDNELEAAAGTGNMYAMYEWGNRYADRDCFQQAYPWFEKAADAGLADGYYMLAGYAVNGWGGKSVNHDLACQYLRKAAELGMLYGAAEQLGDLLIEIDTPTAAKEACKWYTILAEGAKEFEREDTSYYQKKASAAHNLMVAFELLGGSADQNLEDQALMAWYFDNEARKDKDRNWPKDDLGSIYFNLGRCGYYRNRTWTRQVLELGVRYNSQDCKKLLDAMR